MGKQYCITALVGDYVTTRTYASANNQWARPTRPLVSSSKTKPRQFSQIQLSWVQFSYAAMYAP